MLDLFFEDIDLNNGDIIKHNDKIYVVWLTYNYGVVAINKKHFYETKCLMLGQEYRDYAWIKRVRKYLTKEGRINK